MIRLAHILIIGIVSLLLLNFVLAPQLEISAAARDEICQSIGVVDGSTNCETEPGGRSLSDLVSIVVNVLSVIVGVAAVIMIIIGGFKYITSGGDSTGVQSAKNTIIFAIVGLVIVALAQIIVFFVISRI